MIGLGNPGPEYAGNRHNVGAMVLDVLAERIGARSSAHRRGRARVADGRLGAVAGTAGPGARVVLAVPRSYMNESGGPVVALRDYYRVPTDRLVIVHDELDLPFGSLRVKTGGGDNGHNGLRSLRRALGTGEVHRVRVGIGRPPGRQDPADFVLRDFSGAERKDLPFVLGTTADAVESLVLRGLEATQGAFRGGAV